jgi:N utilization substance protein B
MTRRSRAREVALQLLFQHDQNRTAIGRKPIERFVRERLASDPSVVPWCLSLYDGVLAGQADIDAKISATAENWRLARMTPVDRNVLRLGVYELLNDPTQLPVAVVIDEMIELARRFGSADSAGFVNGILDKISKSRNAELGTRNEDKPAS